MTSDAETAVPDSPEEAREASRDVGRAAPCGGFRGALYVVAGSISVGLAVLGVVLPVLPTTPFVLLAAACFARGSTKCHAWLLRSRTFGPLIERWQATRTITHATKVTSIVTLVLVLGSTIVFATEERWVQVTLAAIGLAVVGFLLRLRTS